MLIFHQYIELHSHILYAVKCCNNTIQNNIDGLVQGSSISNALEILQSCIKPSTWYSKTVLTKVEHASDIELKKYTHISPSWANYVGIIINICEKINIIKIYTYVCLNYCYKKRPMHFHYHQCPLEHYDVVIAPFWCWRFYYCTSDIYDTNSISKNRFSFGYSTIDVW